MRRLTTRLLATFVLGVFAGCKDLPTDAAATIPEGSLLSADVSLTVEVVPGPRAIGEPLAGIAANTRVTARLHDGRFVFERTTAREGAGGPQTTTTTYAVDDSVMAEILPALSYLSASYAPPDSSDWENLDYTSGDGHSMTWVDNTGSIGQPLWGSLVIDGLTEYKEMLTWTPTSYGVTLNTARYEVTEPSSGSLIRMTAIVDSMRVTILSDQPWLRLPMALAGYCGTQAGRVIDGLVGGTPFWPTTLNGEMLAAFHPSCYDAKVDLWLARGLMVTTEIAFLLAPNPGTFSAFLLSLAYVGTMRGRMLQTCRKT